MSEKISVFDALNKVNVNGHTEQKNGLTYLSWAWAWAEVKKQFPDAAYTVYERDAEYGPVNYFTDGRTCWVKTGVTINGLEHIEELPVMDFKNRSIPFDALTSTDVNKAIQRSLTKACARHGLGLYIYAGEDLPEGEEEKPAKKETKIPLPPKEERIYVNDPPSTRKKQIDEIMRVAGWSQEQIAERIKVLVANGEIPDKKTKDMTDEEFTNLTYKLSQLIELPFA